MNLSGSSVKKLIESLQIKIHPNPRQNLKRNRILIVHDEISKPFGSFTLKYKGGDGGKQERKFKLPSGHNGLKDVERNLGTEFYHRLKMGIGEGIDGHSAGNLSVHVLSQFDPDEKDKLEKFLNGSVEIMDNYIHKNILLSMQFANNFKF
jgi:peptidyl-tRNA hydrolase, PTH1 family